MANSSRFLVQDGIIYWFDGPEWDEVAKQSFETASAQLVAKAQSNAPWQDITGDARRGLDAKVEDEQGAVSLYLFHTVEYGLWLEVIQNGKFATIMPTLEQEGPRILRNAEARIKYARRGKNY